MNFSKQSKLRILVASIILILLLVPGVSLAEQVIKTIYKKMVVPVVESPQTTAKPEDAGDPIINEAAATIEDQLNTEVTDLKVWGQTIYGNWIVYCDKDTQRMVAYNLKSKEERVISNTQNYKDKLVMFKNRLAWREENAIWAYDYQDGSILEVASQKEGLNEPDIYGDLLVYKSQDGIYLYNFKTKETVTISEKLSTWHSAPTIWKDIITWVDETSGKRNVFYYDLKKSKKTNLTNNTTEIEFDDSLATPKSIVYTFWENNAKQFAEYDLSTGKTRTLPALKPGKFNIKVDKYDGGSINYVRSDDEINIINLDTDELKTYEKLENKAVYGGVVIGTKKDATAKFKVDRN